jgi:hypothetical protein
VEEKPQVISCVRCGAGQLVQLSSFVPLCKNCLEKEPVEVSLCQCAPAGACTCGQSREEIEAKAGSEEICANFGEVLVALGQGKVVLDDDGHQIKMVDNWLEFKDNLGYWHILDSEDARFSYPAPIHEEPKTVEVDVWINIYPAEYNQDVIYLTKKRADELARPSRIACINIKRTVTEGEGL